MNAAKGLVNGCLLSLVLWALIIGAVWVVMR